MTHPAKPKEQSEVSYCLLCVSFRYEHVLWYANCSPTWLWKQNQVVHIATGNFSCQVACASKL